MLNHGRRDYVLVHERLHINVGQQRTHANSSTDNITVVDSAHITDSQRKFSYWDEVCWKRTDAKQALMVLEANSKLVVNLATGIC